MAIPEFPQFAPLVLEHKTEVDRAFAEMEPTISEFTFTNLFMWQHYYNISVSRMHGCILFLAEPPGKKPFFYPPWGQGDTGRAARDCLQFLADKGEAGHIERVPQDYIERYAHSLRGLEITPDPDNDDYVYSSQDLIFLEGRRLHAKRNAIRKVHKVGDNEYRAIDEGLIGPCLELQELWCRQQHRELYLSLAEETMAVKTIFDNYQALGVKGGAILINGRVEAFSIGERLNSDTLVIHVEKANLAIPGLYAVINQQFAEHEARDHKYVNREQDLGDKGLRMAKRSYYPSAMVRKFKVAR
ncbi:MAG: DUF2156 domain-containing protein [Chloroflexi bacterium]|nr:DUF2156 domain-containing protein [Chloroflexota bacterium]